MPHTDYACAADLPCLQADANVCPAVRLAVQARFSQTCQTVRAKVRVPRGGTFCVQTEPVSRHASALSTCLDKTNSVFLPIAVQKPACTVWN